ncbi:glyoxalase/bleomycin resistance protein/dioxygenase [Devosia soli]|uniref:Glyoxalase/bleomycin resistance protein/dioxygenase n=1 Tax=Devosia soli TaxID=361041 RepID=A0A0F5LDH6_9HYPH|nr:VOC family protein [Devosia soli]KKB80239.1 glyoxalase/bleomycin resistance protein/dioxygenase [Devosia soli]
MSITTTTHLNFRGQAREALEFYRSIFGGQLMVATHSQAYPSFPAEEADLVAFGQVESPEGFRIMAFDVPAARPFDSGISPVFVSVRGSNADEITRYWNALSQGATIIQPLAPSGWTPLYGMLTDRFGITWVLDVAQSYGS